ncbi:MAG: Fic family protein [Deltaproteobacteria bacterium]|nr:Fic family protein [Deltaproteobacteria bacterium]
MKERYPEIEAQTAVLRRRLARLRVAEREGFHRWVEYSWVHHDSALEGLVTQIDEVREAAAGVNPVDSGLLPVYRELRLHLEAVRLVREESGRKKLRVRMDFVRGLYHHFVGDADDPHTSCYRRDIPIHRLYFHDIAPPDRIAYRMQRIVSWSDSADFRRHHPFSAAVILHHRFMEAFPFPSHSGKIGRLLMNLVLLHHGFFPVVVHSTDRHRYYESLRGEPEDLSAMIEESADNSLRSWTKLTEHRRMLVG